jgi:hypothetical protein
MIFTMIASGICDPDNRIRIAVRYIDVEVIVIKIAAVTAAATAAQYQGPLRSDLTATFVQRRVGIKCSRVSPSSEVFANTSSVSVKRLDYRGIIIIGDTKLKDIRLCFDRVAFGIVSGARFTPESVAGFERRRSGGSVLWHLNVRVTRSTIIMHPN